MTIILLRFLWTTFLTLQYTVSINFIITDRDYTRDFTYTSLMICVQKYGVNIKTIAIKY